ncbi:MAG: cell division protein ZapE [Rickettsiales bacterium]
MSQAKQNTFMKVYTSTVTDGTIRADAAQAKAAAAFGQLFDQLTQPTSPGKRRWLRLKANTAAPGLYVWGDVGRGKSMLMDLFVGVIEKEAKTRRVHFHAFMRDVHKHLFAYRQNHSGDVLGHVITELAGEVKLLCIDELQVSDVTDAMILTRLFGGLMEAGVTIVFTSNRPPRQLYQGGLQREQFLKFVDLLEARLPIIRIDSPEDYRLAQLRAMKRTYVYPRGEVSDDFLLESWTTLTHGATNEPFRIEVDGRTLRVDKQANGVAWLTFAELCMRPLGTGDYLELCSYCHTLILQGIPRLSREDRNEAKRFITLIDALYDHRVKLIATAETQPNGIYEHGDGTFEFARTVSRLIEMQSEAYLALPKI